jgi:hypothetical protein
MTLRCVQVVDAKATSDDQLAQQMKARAAEHSTAVGEFTRSMNALREENRNLTEQLEQGACLRARAARAEH